MKVQRTQNSHSNFEKEWSWRTNTTDLKIYYRSEVVKKVSHWYQDGYVDHSKIECPEIDPNN